jgi:hypothetical protein
MSESGNRCCGRIDGEVFEFESCVREGLQTSRPLHLA